MRNLKAPAVAVTRGAVLLLTDDYALNLQLSQSTEEGEKKKATSLRTTPVKLNAP